MYFRRYTYKCNYVSFPLTSIYILNPHSILKARKNALVLDPIIVVRDVFFYGVSLMLLMLALSDRRDVDGDDDEHVFVTFFHSSLLVGCYIVYVLVCAYWEKVLFILKVDTGNEVNDGYRTNEFKSFSIEDKHVKEVSSLPFVRSVLYEPPSNFNHSEGRKYDMEEQGSTLTELRSISNDSDDGMGGNGVISKSEPFLFDEIEPKLKQLRWIEYIQREVRCSRFNPFFPQKCLFDVFEFSQGNGNFSLFLWVRSSFYNKTRIGINAWQLRWFTFTGKDFSSQPGFKPNKTKNLNLRTGLGKRSRSVVVEEDIDGTEKKGQVVYPPLKSFEVDEAHLILKVNTSSRDCKFCILFRAMNLNFFLLFVYFQTY